MIFEKDEIGANNEIFVAFKEGKRVRHKKWDASEFIFYCFCDHCIYDDEQQKQSETNHLFWSLYSYPEDWEIVCG